MLNFNLSKKEKLVIFLSSLGGALEFYDFVIFVFFAGTLSQLFFPQQNHLTSLLEVFAVFAIGYLFRPLGGIIFSHFGDKYGRKKTFVSTLILMALPTLLIGLLPTNQMIGIWAGISLTILRIMQGLSLGGEIAGSMTFAAEHVNPKYRGLAGGIIFFGLNMGMALGSTVCTLLVALASHDQLLMWGWRIAFIFGGILGFVSYYLRKNMQETPAFIALQQQTVKSSLPLYTLLRNYWPKVLQGIALTCLHATIICLLFLYLPTYLTAILHYNKSVINLLNTLNIVFFSALIIIAGYISDFLGRRVVFLCGTLCLIILGYSLFYLLSLQQLNFVILAMITFSIFSCCVSGVCACTIVELFPTNVRYSGMAVAFNIGLAVFGGLAPIFATYLIKVTNNVISPSYYLIFCAIIALCGALPLKSKHGKALT